MQPSQPPQGLQQPGQYPPQYSRRYFGLPLSTLRRNPRLAIVMSLITAAAIILLYYFAFSLPAAQAAASQPRITLSMPSPSHGMNCYVNGCVIWVGGTLSNGGSADGYATVNWVLNGNVTQQVRFLVPAQQAYGINLSQPWPEGNSVPDPASGLQLISVQKA